MGFFDKLKKWLKPKNEKIKDANRVTNYGGGVKRNDTVSEVKRSIYKAEKAQEKKQSTQTATRGSAFKATPPSVKKAEAKDKQTQSSKPTRSNAFKATPPKISHHSTALGTLSDATTPSAFKATSFKPKTNREKWEEIQYDRGLKKARREWLAELQKEKVEAKYPAGAPETKRAIKMGDYAADPEVAKYEVLKHPIASSAARGGLNAVTLGASDFAAKRLTEGDYRKAEEFYQANKNKAAETAGMLAGSLLTYGGTAGAFENLGARAVGRAAETQIGKRLGAEALKRTMAGTGAKAALTRSLVGDAIQDSTMGLVDTAMNMATRDDLETPNDYARALVEGQLANYGMGLAGNAVAHGIPVARRAWSNFADESRKLRFVPKGVDELAAERKRILDDIFSKNERSDPAAISRLKEIDAEIERIKKTSPDEITEGTVKKSDNARKKKQKTTDETVKKPTETAAPKEKITEDNVKKEAPRKPTKNEQRRAELQAERDELAEQYRLAKESGSTSKQELQQIADDMMELDAMLKDLDGKIRKADARRAAKQTNAQPAAEAPRTEAPRTEAPRTEAPRTEAPRAEEPESGIVARGESVESGENANAGAGERTEFRRSNEETAREQARNRRTEGNRQRATQETFDSDYDDFVRKANENQAKINELKDRLRNASEEEKAALKQQINELKDAVKSAYRRASLRYHPDRGGSNEWMGKFNEAFDSFNRGSYSSRGFSGASSSTRANTNARNRAYERYRRASSDGGGNTPPPRSNKAASGEGGFKKPKGKAKKGYARTVDSVEDIVYKRAERETFVERASKVSKDARMRVADSHAPFEDVARKYAKSNPEKMQNMYGSIDAHRRSNGYANRSIGEKQINYMGQAYKDSKSIKDIYQGMDKKTEQAFDAYLLLKHAPDRLREGTPIFDNIFAKNVGGKLDDPKVIQSEIDRLLREHPGFEKKAEDIYRYTQNELKNLVDAGLVSKETAAEWATNHPFYVPTHRAGYNGMATNVHGSTVGASGKKATKGSDYDIRSIRDQLEEMTRQNWEDITLNDMLKDVFSDRIPKTALSEPIEDLERGLGNSISIAKSADGKKFYAEVYIKGKKKRFEIEKAFVDGLEDWNKHGKFGAPVLDVPNEALSKVVKYYKGLITEWNPIFMVKNPLRDFPEAYINSRQSREFRKSIGKAFIDLKKGGEYSTALKNMGISQSSFFDLDKAILEESERRGVKKALGAVGDRLESGNQFMEMLPRLTEFMATFEKAGKTLEQAIADGDKALLNRAAANAADVTVNFGRSGSMGKAINKGFVPFFNPSVQGWSKFIRNFQEQPGAKAYLEFFAKAGALGVGITTANNFLLKDNPNYQQISARDKANNIIIPAVRPFSGEALTTDTFIRIPQSRFASVLSLPGVNAFNENKMGWADMIRVANDQVAPVNPIDSHILSVRSQLKRNETWYGTPIVPESVENKSHPSEEYDVNTSNIGKGLGKLTEKLPKELQISPKKADYVIDQEAGIIGDVLLPLTTPSRQGGGKGLKKYGPALLSPWTRPFTIDTTTQNDLSTRFYDKMQKAEDDSKSSKGTKADKDEYNRMSAYSTEISGINRAIKYKQGGDSETKLTDIRELQKIRNQMMKDALDGKAAPNSTKTMDSVQKYVGTTYAVENFGSSTDKRAMKLYGKKVYGKLSDEEMQKKMDADKDFYKGVKAIHGLEEKVKKSGVESDTTLTKAIALASIDASDDLFGAYKGTSQSRTESANEMERARTYFKDGGSTAEYVKLEKTRKTLGKLPEDQRKAELEKLDEQFAKGDMSYAEYDAKESEINYNADTSYVGLATSLAQANSPARGYRVYDIKDKNIQKGINLAAMGFTARDYRDMAKAVDTDGNGYPKKQEIIDYVSKSNVADKATLYDALYYYKGKYNPFGTPTNYTRAQAADAGKAKGVEWITDERDDIEVNPEEASGSGYGYRGYYRYGRWHRWGSYSRKGRGATMDKSAFKGKNAPSAKPTYKSLATNLKASNRDVRADYDTSSVKYQTAKASKLTPKPKAKTTAKKTPPKVKFKKYEV